MPTNNFNDLLKIQTNQASESMAEVSPKSESSSKSSKLSQSAWRRLIFVLVIVAIPVGLIMIFFGSAMNLKASLEKEQPENVTAKLEQSDAEIKQAKEENLRGIVAYQQQAQAIKGIEDRKATPEIKLEPQESKVEVEAKPIPAPATSQSTPVVRRHSYSSPPVSVSKPQPRVISNSVPKVSKAIEYDSMSDWQNLANLGSYGGEELTVSRLPSSTTSIGERMLRKESQVNNNASYNSSLPPVVAVNVSSQKELTETEALFLEALQSANEPQNLAISNKSSSSVAMAQQVKGKLNTGINYIEGMPAQRSFIRLEEPFLDVNEVVQIPAGSLLVYEIHGVTSGIIDGRVTAFLKDDQEYSLPKNAISVLAKNGDFLMARYKEVRNGGNSSFLDFALGAAQQTNNLINRPNSSFSSSTEFGSSSSVDYGSRNYPGAIVSGGLEKVLESKTEELTRRSNSSSISSFWELKQGSTVMLQVNFAFSI